MTVGEWVQTAQRRLTQAGVESARLEAQVLAAHVMRVDRSWVLAHPEAEINELAAEVLLQRRERREPLSYIVGHREFYGRKFKVGPGVLVPRQETELLVDGALAAIDASPSQRPQVLDVGLGSGCIAITIKLERPAVEVTGVDVSQSALVICQENAEMLGADISILRSAGFESVPATAFDVVVSNPPYVKQNAPLMPEVGLYEPPEALFAGEDGLDAFRWLSTRASQYMAQNGSLLVEIGEGQSEAVTVLFEQAGWRRRKVLRDLCNVDRVLIFGLF